MDPVLITGAAGFIGYHVAERYLAAGRPVVLQDTGFSAHLPCGEGLHAVADIEDAAAALEAIDMDYPRHARRAREIARDYLDTRVVVADLLTRLGL